MTSSYEAKVTIYNCRINIASCHYLLSTVSENWLWHSFRDVVRRVGYGADVTSVIMCAVRS
jgi:hypothetical protein